MAARSLCAVGRRTLLRVWGKGAGFVASCQIVGITLTLLYPLLALVAPAAYWEVVILFLFLLLPLLLLGFVFLNIQ